MKVDDFEQLYMAELEELRSVESQMIDHLGQFADQATNTTLSEAIDAHRDQTNEHRNRIDHLLEAHGGRPEAHQDASMHAILDEAEKWAGMIESGSLRDAGLIASLQRMEHYEIAVLGTLANWAKKLGHDDDAMVLSHILDQNRQTDARLSAIAEEIVNPAAS